MLRYRNDLEKEESVALQVDYHLMVRYRLYKHQEIYGALFELAQSELPDLR